MAQNLAKNGLNHPYFDLKRPKNRYISPQKRLELEFNFFEICCQNCDWTLVKTVQIKLPISQVFEICYQKHDETLVKKVQIEPPFSQVFEICCQKHDRTLVKTVPTEPHFS